MHLIDGIPTPQTEKMNRSLKLVLLILFVFCKGVFATAEADFYGSPYELVSVEIRDVSRNLLHKTEPLPNHYYVRFPLSESIPENFEITFQLKSITGAPLSDPPVISLYLPATYRLFWDNQLIGFNGRFDEDKSERTLGNSYRSFTLPIPTNPNQTHTLRIEGVHTLGPDNEHAFITTLQTITERLATARNTALTYALYFAFGLFGIYLITFYLANHSRIHFLLLGLTCITFGLYAVNKLAYYQLNVPYPYLDWIGYIARAIFISLSLLIPATSLYILGYRKKRIYLLAGIPLLVNSLNLLELIPAAAYLSCTIALVSLLQKRRHALPALVVSLILLSSYVIPYFAQRQAIGFGLLAFFLFVSIINLQRRETKERALAQIRNTRLQLELLKSKIEPHFVLNSLTSAIEWIETNPRQGVKLIQALAHEFEILSNISDKSEIPMATEIESCETYLQIMGYRKKASYHLDLKDVDLSSTLPPAVIRNLLENAISHNAYSRNEITFTLTQSNENNRRHLRFQSPIANCDDLSEHPEDGTGVRYIKARLAETYPAWSFSHGPKNGVWETEIIVP